MAAKSTALSYPGCTILFLGLLSAICHAENSPGGITDKEGTGRISIETIHPVMACASLKDDIRYEGLQITSAILMKDGDAKQNGLIGTIPEHCLIAGELNKRTSPVDGKVYAIGFEMRLPEKWNGRFFYQTNGGLDGIVVPAFGNLLGGGPKENALMKGYAVISTNGGHNLIKESPIGGGLFGIDPQARLDYGYNAIAQATPMAKYLIKEYFGTLPKYSYIVGSSNGGRTAVMAAARDIGKYDGVLVTTPGFHLPQAAATQLWDAQQFATVAPKDSSGRPVLSQSFSRVELGFVARKILEKCDGLDGLTDGIIGDPMACRNIFKVHRDIRICSANQKDQCLSKQKIAVLNAVFSGPKDMDGHEIYRQKFWDIGIAGEGWRNWKFVNSIGPRDPLAMAFVFSTPPEDPRILNGEGSTLIDYVMNFDVRNSAKKIHHKNSVYSNSAAEFMIPPEMDKLTSYVSHNGKIIVAHGVSDPVFSVMDTAAWVDSFRATQGVEKADEHLRFYLIPGMNHSQGGPSTDQFNLFTPLTEWVEKGVAPDAVVAYSRGKHSNLPNPEVPSNWSDSRSRLLCPYPLVARYKGGDNTESHTQFHCAH